ncbi:MAG: 6-carboxytetrahydropterin synthase QueD [bacterium]
MYELMVEGTFDAAHQLMGYKGPCENLHGHTWKAQIYLQGDKLGDQNMLLDFKKVKKMLGRVLDKFDHQCLNKLKTFRSLSPTSENVARIIYESVKAKLRKEKHVKISRVTVYESEITSATYWE